MGRSRFHLPKQALANADTRFGINNDQHTLIPQPPSSTTPTDHHRPQRMPWPPPPTTNVDHPQRPPHAATHQAQGSNATSPTKRALARSRRCENASSDGDDVPRHHRLTTRSRVASTSPALVLLVTWRCYLVLDVWPRGVVVVGGGGHGVRCGRWWSVGVVDDGG